MNNYEITNSEWGFKNGVVDYILFMFRCFSSTTQFDPNDLGVKTCIWWQRDLIKLQIKHTWRLKKTKNT